MYKYISAEPPKKKKKPNQSSFRGIISEEIKWYLKTSCRKVSFSFVTKPCTHVETIFVKSFLFNMVCVRQ